MRVEPQQLKAFLLDAGLVSENQFDKAVKQSKKTHKRIEDILSSEGLMIYRIVVIGIILATIITSVLLIIIFSKKD